MQLGFRVAVAVAVAGSYSSDLTPSLGTSMCQGCSPLKSKKGEVEAEMHSCVLLKKSEFGIWELLNLKNIP